MPDERKTKCESFGEWVRGPSCAIFANYFLGSWGDRMWHFAAGLYLVYLANDSLRLAAIFGFASGGLALLFGGILGNWVDKNGRLKVVRIALFVQNICVALCATTVCLVLVYEEKIRVMLDGHLKGICEALIIFFGLIASLASIAYKIAIEKDWIVVVASGNSGKLSNLNAVTRAIDLLCKILAPTFGGFIMTYGSLVTAAIVIAGWNIVSVFVEYALLHRVYSLVPSLATKTGKVDKVEDKNADNNLDVGESKDNTLEKDQNELPENSGLLCERLPSQQEKDSTLTNAQGEDKKDEVENIPSSEKVEEDGPATGAKVMEPVKQEDADTSDEDEAREKEPLKQDDADANSEVEAKNKESKTCLQLMCRPFVTLVHGWKRYMKQRIVFAGLALSFLYMTVLGFDSVTLGYIYANDVEPLYVGLTMAMGGVTGILGTFVFTRLSRRIGLERTGLMAFNAEIVCLSFCVMSIFTPGSHFDPTFHNPAPNCSLYTDASIPIIPDLQLPVNKSMEIDSRVRRSLPIPNQMIAVIAYPSASHEVDSLAFNPGLLENGDQHIQWLTYEDIDLAPHSVQKRAVPILTGNTSATAPSTIPIDAIREDIPVQCQPGFINVSIILFLIGIVSSRVGLWMADLVVTQLLQEHVAEHERGIINGVQNSLNMMMEMLKFTLVIALPSIPTFGILIILSFAFICAAGCLFAFHSWRERGHLFHFDKMTRCITPAHQNGVAVPANGNITATQKRDLECV